MIGLKYRSDRFDGFWTAQYCPPGCGEGSGGESKILRDSLIENLVGAFKKDK